MSLFFYKVVDARGKKLNGVIDADNIATAKERLTHKNLFIIKLSSADSKLFFKKRFTLNNATLINFTREMTQLLQSGLPLYESLLTIEEKYRSHKHHFIFLDLCDRVKQGKNFSEALSQYPETFDPIYISMVAAGEKTGVLGETFLNIYKVISRNAKIKSQIKSALIYPAFLGSFCMVVLLGLFLFLIPSMKELLAERHLHTLTKSVLVISDFLVAHGFVLFAFIGIIITAVVIGCRQTKVKNRIKKTLLNIPILKRLITEAVLMRFSRVFSALLASGLPITEALKLSKTVMNHPSYEKIIDDAAVGINEGKKLSYMLSISPLIPPLVFRMLATAEETGGTQKMLKNISEIYETALEKSLTQFTNLIQPAMLLVLGMVVGLVLLSVLLPMTDVSAIM